MLQIFTRIYHPATFLTQYSAHPSDYLRYPQKKSKIRKHGSLSQDYNFESHKWSQIQMKLGWLSRKKNTWHQQIILGHNHNGPQYRKMSLPR